MNTTTPIRCDGRGAWELRALHFTIGYLDHCPGSVLVEMGKTRVLCVATIEERVPAWMRGSDLGWLTAEYAMLPNAGHGRTPRESARGKIKGRTHEIQRLIGRSLRGVIDLGALRGHTVQIDCDVIQADGGTRTASVSGAWVATALALRALPNVGTKWRQTLRQPLAAVSVGVVGGKVLLDLCYEEDKNAEVDMNVVMTGDGRFVEIQGTAEGAPFDRAVHGRLLDTAQAGIERILTLQAKAVEP
jgi:ribonuclease PH